MTDIISLQRDDHARLHELIAAYESSGTRERPEVFRALVDLVTTHAFAEETVLFPASRRLLGQAAEQLTSDIEAEHQRANELLKSMERSAPGDPGFEAQATELFVILQHDARQEEDVLLARLAVEHAGELEPIGSAWLATKRIAPNRAHPKVSRRPPGNALAAPVLTLVDHARSFVARVRGRAQ